MSTEASAYEPQKWTAMSSYNGEHVTSDKKMFTNSKIVVFGQIMQGSLLCSECPWQVLVKTTCVSPANMCLSHTYWDWCQDLSVCFPTRKLQAERLTTKWRGNEYSWNCCNKMFYLVNGAFVSFCVFHCKWAQLTRLWMLVDHINVFAVAVLQCKLRVKAFIYNTKLVFHNSNKWIK